MNYHQKHLASLAHVSENMNIENGIGTAMDNDFPVLRLADVVLMRAEALWRLNNSSSEAVELIRQVRERVGLDALGPL